MQFGLINWMPMYFSINLLYLFLTLCNTGIDTFNVFNQSLLRFLLIEAVVFVCIIISLLNPYLNNLAAGCHTHLNLIFRVHLYAI